MSDLSKNKRTPKIKTPRLSKSKPTSTVELSESKAIVNQPKKNIRLEEGTESKTKKVVEKKLKDKDSSLANEHPPSEELDVGTTADIPQQKEQCSDDKCPDLSVNNLHAHVNKSGVKFDVGVKVEALDRLKKWYPAKIIQIRSEDRLALIHFERWNSRYDEWIPYDSDRLRPVVRISARKNSPQKDKNEYQLDEIVLAKWFDRKMYPAKIIKFYPRETFCVKFFDGVEKRMKVTSICKLPPEMADKQTSPSKNSAKEVDKSKSKRSRLIVGGKFQAKRKTKVAEETISHDKPNLIQKEKKSTSSVDPGISSNCSDVGKEKVDAIPVALSSSTNDLSALVLDPLVARKEFIIEKDHNHFKCTFESCGKSFRKEKFLQAHLKHYHVLSSKDQTSELKTVDPIVKSVKKAPKLSGIKTVEEVVSAKSEATVDQPVNIKKEVIEPAEIEKIMDTEEKPLPLPVLPPKDATPNTLKKNSDNCVQKQKSCSRKRVKSGSLSKNIVIEEAPVAKLEIKKEVETDKKSSLVEESVCTSIPSPFGEPKIELPKTQVRSPSKLKSSDIELNRIRSISEGDKLTAPTTFGHSRTSKRRRLDTADSISSTISIDSASVYIEDCSFGEGVLATKPEGAPKKSKSRSRKNLHGSSNSFHEVVRDEIVNCNCGLNDENGLMVQCELCLAWQHGSCAGILQENQVPDKYICYNCINPKLARQSMRYNWDQDWFKKGELSKFKFLCKEDSSNLTKMDDTSTILSCHNLTSSLLTIKNVVHSLKCKLKIAENKYHPDLDEFKQPWSRDCKAMVGNNVGETFNLDGTNVNMDAIVSAIGALGIPLANLNQAFNSSDPTGMFYDQSLFPTPKTQDGAVPSNEEGGPSSQDKMRPQNCTTDEYMMPASNDDMLDAALLPQSGSTVASDDFNVPLPMTMSDCELVRGLTDNFNESGSTLTSEEQEMISALSKPLYPMMPPVPREPDVEQYQRNVADHIEQVHDQLDHRLNFLEAQIEILEMENEASTEKKSSNCNMSMVKRKIKKFLRDMHKLHYMTEL